MFGPALLTLSLLLLVASVLYRSVRAHAEVEARAQIVELLARALTRGRSLPQLFARLTQDFPGRLAARLARAETALEEGASLADALEAAGRPLFPAPWPDLVRAIEGDRRLAGVLQVEARREARHGRFLERLLVTLVYPAMLAFGAVVLHGLFAWTRPEQGGFIVHGPDIGAAGVAGIASALVAALLVWRVRRLPAICRLGVRTSKQRARILRLLGALLEAGVPLHAALERVRPLARNRGLDRVIANAAEVAADGAPAPEVLATLEPSRRQAARIRSASAHALIERLRSVAAHLDGRTRTRERGLLAGIRPGAVVVIGVVVLIGYAGFMHYLGRAAEAARPMPW